MLGDEPKPLHINFYDIPGIGEKNNVGEEELEMVIDGKIKPGVEVRVFTSNKEKYMWQRKYVFCFLSYLSPK